MKRTNAKMKRKWIPLVALIPTIVLITAIQAWSTTITFDILDTYIEVNETFSVNVYAQEDAASGDLNSFGFDVEVLSSLLTYTGYDITASDWMDVGYNTDNVLFDANYVAGFWNPNWPADPFATNAGDTILLATLDFTAGSSAGTTTLSINGENDGMDLGAFYTNFYTYTNTNQDILDNLDITIHAATATAPEPTTVLLFGLGLAGMSGILRKTQKRLS